MSKLEVEFQYELGDVVYFRAAKHSLRERPNPYMIVERLAQQCPGGVQLLYRLANCLSPHFTNEIELSRDLPPYQRELPERTAERREMAEQEREDSRRAWRESAKAAMEAEPSTEKE